MKPFSLKQWSAERISQTVLYLLSALILVSFVLFYLIGFDMPYLFNPSLNAPLLTDLVLGMMFLLLPMAAISMIWSMARTSFRRSRGAHITNNIPTRKLAYIVSGGTIALLALTLLLGSTEAVWVNGQIFTDMFWLKVSDMLILSSISLLAIAALAVVYGRSRSYRKPQK